MRDCTAKSWKLLVSLALLLSGLGAWATDPTEDDPPPKDPTQGVHLHATGPFEHVNIALGSALAGGCSGLSFSGGVLTGKNKLKAACTEKDFEGVSFLAPHGGLTAQFTIERAQRHENRYMKTNQPAASKPWEFVVKWSLQKPGGQVEQGPLCATRSNLALAVPHAWSSAGELLPNSHYFTFACVPEEEQVRQPVTLPLPRPGVIPTPIRLATVPRLIGGGVIAKCIDWGYPPWPQTLPTLTGSVLTGFTVGKAQVLEANDEQQALQFHRACVRMASADYCSEGQANTLDGTPIIIQDVKSVKTDAKGNVFQGPYKSAFHFEAAWGVDECGKVRAICLSKRRWSSLAASGACIDSSVLPKSYLNKELPVYTYCESMDERTLERAGALLFSYSTFVDKGLYRFESSSDKSLLTTTSVNTDNPVLDKSGLAYTLDTKRIKVSSQYYSGVFEGPILSAQLPQELVSRMKLKPLYRCRHTSNKDHFLTIDREDCGGIAGYALDTTDTVKARHQALEGYIYRVGEGLQSSPLYLWKNAASRYATSTVQPAVGYERVGEQPLGYLPPMSQLAELSEKAPQESASQTPP